VHGWPRLAGCALLLVLTGCTADPAPPVQPGVPAAKPAAELDYQPSGSAVVYVDSHDTQRGGNTLTYKDGYPHTLATEFMLAWPSTDLPAGVYRDRLSASSVTVDNAGRATITIPAQGALAFDVSAANDAKDTP
jgi:hypothetical protein